MAIIDDLKDPEALKKMETIKARLITHLDKVSKEIRNLRTSLEAREQIQKELESIFVDLFGEQLTDEVEPGLTIVRRDRKKDFDEGRPIK